MVIKKIAKSDDIIKNYLTCLEYPSFPRSREEQRRIVSRYYSEIRNDGGNVSVDDACDGRIFYVARSLYSKAQREMDKMTGEDICLIKRIAEMKLDNYKKNSGELMEEIGLLLAEAKPSDYMIMKLNRTLKLRGYNFSIDSNADTSFDASRFGGTTVDDCLDF